MANTRRPNRTIDERIAELEQLKVKRAERAAERAAARENGDATGSPGRKPLVYNVTIGKGEYVGRPARRTDFGQSLYVMGTIPLALRQASPVAFVDADGTTYVPTGFVLSPRDRVDEDVKRVPFTVTKS